MRHPVALRIKRNIPIYIAFAIIILIVVYAKAITVEINNLNMESFFWQMNIWFDDVDFMDDIISLILLITPFVFIQMTLGDILNNDTGINGSLLFTRYKSKTQYVTHFIMEQMINILIMTIIIFTVEYLYFSISNYTLLIGKQTLQKIAINFIEVYSRNLNVILLTNLLAYVIRNAIQATIVLDSIIICCLIFINQIRTIAVFKIIPIISSIINEQNMIIISAFEILITIIILHHLVMKRELYC